VSYKGCSVVNNSVEHSGARVGTPASHLAGLRIEFRSEDELYWVRVFVTSHSPQWKKLLQ